MNWWRVNKVGEFLRELMDFKREESLSKFDFVVQLNKPGCPACLETSAQASKYVGTLVESLPAWLKKII